MVIQQDSAACDISLVPGNPAGLIRSEDHRLPMVRIGLLGCGNIGHLLAANADGFTIGALYDLVPERARELAQRSEGVAYDSFEAFVDADVDLIVEAASIAAVRAHGEAVLAAGKDLVVMSVGAPEAVSDEAVPLLSDPVRAARMREGLALVRSRLGAAGASRRAAEAILKVAGIR
jgi:predicted dinucleotide-utilizing enzyme